MTTKERIIRAIKHPRYIGSMLLTLFTHWIKDDEWYIKMRYRLYVGKKLRLNSPKTFNEKLQWLKLYDRKPIYTTMVDKCEVKKHVANIIGEEHIIPTIAVYDKVEDIDFNALPDHFVMKCTHDSGGLVICKDKSKLEKKAAIRKLRRCLKRSYYWRTREWPYKDVKPRIIVEKYMEDESGWQLKDYKIFCFNGEPRFIEVDYDRYVGHKLNVYDLNWNFVDFYMTSPNDKNVKIAKPEKLNQMLEYSRMLAKDIPFVRVDFYSIYSNIYFGEMTFSPGSGTIDFHPKEYDLILGEMLKLPLK
jgi:hypothetical protein